MIVRKICTLLMISHAFVIINAQLIKNDFMKDIAYGDIIEKGMYERKNSSLRKNQWNLCAFYEKIDGYSPEAVEPLTYRGYTESNKDNAIRLKCLKERNGSCHTGYSLTNSSAYSLGQYYVAFMVNVDPGSDGGDKSGGFFMFDATHTSDYKRVICSMKKADNRHVFFGIGEKDGAPAVFSSKRCQFSMTHLIVIKYDFDSKLATLYINPQISEIEPKADATIMIDDKLLQRNGIRAFTLRQRSIYACDLGGIRFAKSWKSAIGIEE